MKIRRIVPPGGFSQVKREHDEYANDYRPSSTLSSGKIFSIPVTLG
jgi:hypothetical protein